jgi:hypothetical protein
VVGIRILGDIGELVVTDIVNNGTEKGMILSQICTKLTIEIV